MKIHNQTLSSIIVDIIPVSIIIVDKNSIIAYGNKHAEQTFGYKVNEMVGKPLSDLIPERFKKSHNFDVIDYINNPRNRPMGNGLNIFASKSDKTEFPAEIGLTHIKDDDGNILIIAPIIDVSNMAALSTRLEKSLQENSIIENKLQELKQKLENAEIKLKEALEK